MRERLGPLIKWLNWAVWGYSLWQFLSAVGATIVTLYVLALSVLQGIQELPVVLQILFGMGVLLSWLVLVRFFIWLLGPRVEQWRKGSGMVPRLMKRSQLESLPSRGRDAKDILIIGRTATGVSAYTDFFAERLFAGAAIRIAVINPNNMAVLTALEPSLETTIGGLAGEIASFRGNIDRVQQAVGEKARHLETRYLDYMPTLSLVVIDGNLPTGEIVVELVPYRRSAIERPLLRIKVSDYGLWFDYFRDIAERIWGEAKDSSGIQIPSSPQKEELRVLFFSLANPAGDEACRLLKTLCSDLRTSREGGDTSSKLSIEVANSAERFRLEPCQGAQKAMSAALEWGKPTAIDDVEELQRLFGDLYEKYEGVATEIHKIGSLIQNDWVLCQTPESRYWKWRRLDEKFLDSLKAMVARTGFATIAQKVKDVGWGDRFLAMPASF